MIELRSDNGAEVEAHLHRLGWIGSEERIVALDCAGAGNMNVVLRARLPERSLILKQARAYVARYPQIAAPITRLESEAAFYRAIAGNAALRRHTPAVLGEDAANHLLCLEDLGDGRDLTGLYGRGRRPDSLAANIATLAGWLTGLHASCTEADVPANDAMRALNHAHIFEIPFDPESGVAVSPALADRRTTLAGDRPLRREAARLGRLYLGTEPCGASAVLLHGDYYPGSWLELADGAVAVIDPEFCFKGPAEFDVGVFIAHLIMAGHDPAALETLPGYTPRAGFSHELARRFAAMEVTRRLLGVAQLPLEAGAAERLGWLDWTREILTT